jgi:hypothetical protein
MLWGFPVEFWDRFGIWSMVAGAGLGVIALFISFASAYVLYRVADVSQKELVAETKAGAERVASLIVQGDQLRKDTAEANARALEAKLALEKLKTPRLLSEQQISVLVEKLKRFAGTKFDAAVIPGDPEAIIFLSYIAATLEKAGWVWVEWTAPEGQIAMTYTIPTKPSIGQLGFFGVTLQINPAHDRALSAPADALGLALIAEGIEATLDVIDNPSVPKRETVHVIVGKKRQ